MSLPKAHRSSPWILLLTLIAAGCGMDGPGDQQGAEAGALPGSGSAVVASLSAYNLTGFATLGAGTTGGGVVAETDPAYRKCYSALDLATAVRDANKTAGAVKVIEIMNDLDLGWNEVGTAVQTLSSTPFRAHATPKLHPALIKSGVSLVDIKAKSGLTIFSASGATIRHATLNIKGTSNVIVRNLKFDEMWEWDEATKGNYDSNDWDFIDLGNGGVVSNVWIDHCTFTKSYDGVVDIKKGSYNITFSWNKVAGDDGATNPNSFVRQQLAALEANRSAYPMYNFFRSNGFSVEDLVALHQGHDKTHLIGSNSLDSGNATFTVTFHHQWYKNTWDRLPRLRAGQVHNYNIYADDTAELTAVRRRNALVAAMSSANQNTANNTYNLRPPLNGSISTEGGAVLVENSVYVDSLWPLRNNQTDPSDPTYTGKILATNTIYTMHNADGSTTTVRGNSTDASNPLGPFQATLIPFSWNTFSALPYRYTLDDPADVPALVQANAGAGVVTWDKQNWLRTSYDGSPPPPPATFALNVTKGGTGSGTVTSNVGGINCGTTCSATIASGTAVTLTATAATGSTFAGWGGACSGTAASCTVSMTAAQSVTATFNGPPPPGYTLTVTRPGAGSGTVVSSPSGISCGSTCSATYAPGTSVTLTAAAASGSTFGGWGGACSGTGPCTVTMTAAQSVTATFNAPTTTCPTVTGGQSGNFNTGGAACYTVNGTINGWGCSNMDGRTVSVNGTPVTCGQLPLPGSSLYIFSFTAGTYPWASFYWW